MRVPRRKSEEGVRPAVDPHLTQAKYDELVSKLDRLKKSVSGLAQEVKLHAQNGDFSENAPYQIAKGKLRSVNQRILELGQQLNRAVIIKEGGDNNVVQLGNKVTVEIGGQEKTYQILGSVETNPAQGIISHNSPIGAALIGQSLGATITVQLNKKQVEYKIIKIF